MFGKKQTSGGVKPPSSKTTAGEKPAGSERLAPIIETPSPAAAVPPLSATPPVLDDASPLSATKGSSSTPADPLGPAEHIGPVLAALEHNLGGDASESASADIPAAASEAGEASAAPKQRKTMQDDVLLPEKEEEEEARSHGDSITTLRLQRCRNRIWLDLRDGIDLKALARMDAKAARDEVYSAVAEISRFRNLDLTPAELHSIAKECADDMLGFGPLEELLERDDIADIMINGPDVTYIEVGGKIERTAVKFRDSQHLITICQRIVGAIFLRATNRFLHHRMREAAFDQNRDGLFVLIRGHGALQDAFGHVSLSSVRRRGSGFLVQNGVHPRDIPAHGADAGGVFQLVGRLLEAQVEGFLLQRDQISAELVRGLGLQFIGVHAPGPSVTTPEGPCDWLRVTLHLVDQCKAC